MLFPKDERFGHSRSSMVRAKARAMLLAGEDNVARPCTPPTAQRTLFEHPSEWETRFDTQRGGNPMATQNALASSQRMRCHSREEEKEKSSDNSARSEDEENHIRSRKSIRGSASGKPNNSDNHRTRQHNTKSKPSSHSSLSRPMSSSHRPRETKQQGAFDAEDNESLEEA
jgi:hypothetical protein